MECSRSSYQNVVLVNLVGLLELLVSFFIVVLSDCNETFVDERLNVLRSCFGWLELESRFS